MDERYTAKPMAQPDTGELDLTDEVAKYTTEEYFTVLSHGIFDHVHKFNPNPFPLYIYLLCNAKKKDPGAGLYSFHIRELIDVFSNPRGSIDNADKTHKSTVCRFLAELERLDLIEIVHRPAGGFDATWRILICKFKTFNSFLCVRNKYSDGVAGPSHARDGGATDESGGVTLATAKQTDMWEEESERRRGVKNDAPSRQRDGQDNNSLLYKYIDSLKEHLRKMNKKYLYDLFEELRSSKKSSEEIIHPDLACRWTQDAMKEINAGTGHVGLKHVRNELLRLYWNGLRMNGRRKPIFDRCTKIGDERQKIIAARFYNPFWRDNWAKALVEIKNSPYCRGEEDNWEATFIWFIKEEKPVVNAMDGRYRDRSKPKETRTTSKGGIIRNVSGQDYLKGVSLSSVQDWDLEEWIRTNPDAAEQAKESGMLQVRLDNRTDDTEV